MFRIRPKSKILTPDELKCCGVVEFEWPWGPEKIPPSTTTDNGDGTTTTEWISASHGGVPNDGGKMYLTLCCGDYLRLDFTDRDMTGYDNWSVYVDNPDLYQFEKYYSFPPDGITVDVHTEQPDSFPIGPCGLQLEMWWEGGVTFSITYGKTP